MKFFGIALCVCLLMAMCPLMAQTGMPASNAPEAEAFVAVPPDAPAYLARPVKVEVRNDGQTLYRWSLAAVASGNAADTFSSWHQPEANPLLAGHGSEFDGRSTLVKSALVGASFLIERWALRQNLHLYRTFAWLNFTIAGVRAVSSLTMSRFADVGQAGSLRRVVNPPERQLTTGAQLAKLPHKALADILDGRTTHQERCKLIL